MKYFTAFCVAAALSFGAWAQTTPQSEVGQRRVDQQDRIANGVQDGQLTTGETGRLENQEAGINQEIRADRTADGGRLTGAEKAQINGQQNHLSREIYSDKHNASVAHYGNNEVGTRRYDQQQRIANGIRSGRLTAGETSNLERGESNINREVRDDRRANGGPLTRGERRSVNRQMNRQSARIYRDKHNGANGPR